jgi:hypothetical protein
MRLQPIKIQIDDNQKKPPRDPMDHERTIGEALDDFVSGLSSQFRQKASKMAGTVLRELHEIRPEPLQSEAYEFHRAVSGAIADMRSDIINGGFKGALAAQKFMRGFGDFEQLPSNEKNRAIENFSLTLS